MTFDACCPMKLARGRGVPPGPAEFWMVVAPLLPGDALRRSEARPGMDLGASSGRVSLPSGLLFDVAVERPARSEGDTA